MAVWQFDLTLHPAPGEAVASNGDPAWSDDRHRSIVALLDASLRRERPWHTDFQTWGSEHGGRVDLFLTDGKLIEVYARVDMRIDPRPLLDLLVRLAEVADADSFETVEDELIPAGSDSVLAAAMASRAARYVRDPEGYLTSLDDDPIKDRP